MSTQILVVDDDAVFNKLLSRRLGAMGFTVLSAESWGAALALLNEAEPDLVLLDFKLPDADATEILPEIAASYPVIILTGFGSIKSAVHLMRAGAADYLTKPVDLDELELTLNRVLEHAELRRSNRLYRSQLAQQQQQHALIGASAAMTRLRETIAAVAPTDATVLILGESGTGKELVASAIHKDSERATQEFVALDCCGLQDTLFESELFGHERGAFTSADRQKKGIIEEAAGGTLFLDEIGDVRPAQQAKLLRVLEAGTYRRVGGNKSLSANVRFVTATNQNLEELVEAGAFRRDLYYRLSRFVIEVPPLRDRRDDIPLIVAHFLQFIGRGMTIDIDRKAMALLQQHDWPGNVRELRNAVERAVIIARPGRVLTPKHFSLLRGGRTVVSLAFDHEPTLDEIESDYFRILHDKYSGNRSRIAAAMGLSERQIYRRLKKTPE